MTIQVIRDLIAETEGELALAESQVARLRDELTAFKSALARRAGVTADDRRPTLAEAMQHANETNLNEWYALSRSDAVTRALIELTAAGTPIGPADLHEFLAQRGRAGDDRDAVSAALAHLQRSGRAHRVAHKMWLPGPRPKDPEGPAVAAAGLSSGTTGSEGGTDHAQDHNHRRDSLRWDRNDDRDDRAPVGALT